MLVGTARGCDSVGQAGSEHRQLVRDVISELASAVSAREGFAFLPGTIERLEAYTVEGCAFLFARMPLFCIETHLSE